MADYWALSSDRVWSNVSNWLTGTTPGQMAGALPGILDDVYANGRFITIDIDASVRLISTVATANAAAGGGFFINNNVSLTANLILPGNSTCLSFISASPNTCTIRSNISGTSVSGGSRFAVRNTNSGTINIVGNISGGAGQDSIAVRNDVTGTINLTGSVTGGTGTSTASDTTGSIGISNAGNGTVSIVGNVSGGSVTAANGVTNLSSGNIFIRGNITGATGGTTCGGVYIANASSGTVNVTGDILPRLLDLGNLGTITNNSQVSATVNIRGNIIGSGSLGILLASNTNTRSQLNIIGNIVGSQINTTRSTILANANLGIYTVTISGNVIGGGIGATTISFTNPGTMTIFGNVSADFGSGITNGSTATVNIFGNVIGGNNTNIYGIQNSTTGIVNVFGTAKGGVGSGAHGVWNNQNNGTVYVARAEGNDWGIFSFSVPPLAYGAATGLWNNALSGRCFVREINCGSRGLFPVGGTGPIWLSGNKNTKAGYSTGTGGRVTTIALCANSDYQPNDRDVRYDVYYDLGVNPDPPFGKLYMPTPNQVSIGTPVDNTLGTATFENPETIWSVSLFNPNLTQRIDEDLVAFDWRFHNRLRNAATLNSLSSVGNSLNNQTRV